MANSSASGTGTNALLMAIRMVQLSSTLLAGAGVFLESAPREDGLPYVLTSVYKAGVGTKKIGGRDSLRTLTIQLKAVAKEDGRSPLDIATELANENYRLFGPEDAGDGLTSTARLNAQLEPMGWTACMPIEAGDIGPYKDHILDLERWHVGHLFRFRIQRLR